MLIDLIAETGVADRVERWRVIQATGAAIGHQQAMERDGQPRLTERLHQLRVSEDAGPGRNDDLLPAVRVHRVGHQTVDGPGTPPVEPIREYGVDDGPFQHAVEGTTRRDRS